MIEEISQSTVKVEAFANGGRVYLANSINPAQWVRFDDPAAVRELITALEESCGQAFPPREPEAMNAAD